MPHNLNLPYAMARAKTQTYTGPVYKDNYIVYKRCEFCGKAVHVGRQYFLTQTDRIILCSDCVDKYNGGY